jgi:hypothetical protein
MGGMIMESIKPSPSWAGKNVLCQGDWPLTATHAVSCVSYNRAFGNREYGPDVTFFNSEEELEEWMVETAQWRADGDWEVSVHATVYEWDLGPRPLGTRYP